MGLFCMNVEGDNGKVIDVVCVGNGRLSPRQREALTRLITAAYKQALRETADPPPPPAQPPATGPTGEGE